MYNNGLPFSPDHIQSNFLNIDLSNPPCVPNYNCAPQIAQFLPVISAAIALEIQNQAQSNRLRIFMFNQYSANAFNNQDFMGLVCMTVDLLTPVLNNGLYTTLEAASHDLIPKMVEALCVLNLRLYPDLERCVNPGAENGIRAVIQTYDQWSQCMNPQFTARFRQQMVGNTGWGSNNVNMDNRPTFSGRGPSNTHSNGGSVFNNSGPRATVINGNNSNNQGTGRDYGSRYADRAQQQQQPQKQATSVVPQDIQPQEIVWYPSAKYPYLPAYNPNRYVLILEKENGIVAPTFKERNVEMDYDRHATGPTTFGAMPKGTDISGVAAAMTKIHSAVEEVNKAPVVEPEDDEVPVTTKINHQWACETSEEGAWFSAELKRFDETLRSENVMPAIYRCYADLAQPILANRKNVEFVQSLANAKAFTVAREILANADDDVNPELLMICKKRLTDLINRIVKQQLSIPKLAIDDFCDDLGELIALIKRRFGDVVSEAFTKFQKEQLAALFRLLTDVETRQTTAQYMVGDVPDDRLVPDVLFLTSGYSLTLVNCLSYQLEIELNPEVAVMVTSKGNQVLFDLMAGLFDVATSRLQKGLNPIARHLLKTIDGRVLEATQGSIVEKAYLLTLVK